jgi:hypothetical protein
MQVVAAAAIALLIGSSTFVAIRLLLLHRRTGGLPELLLGWMLMLSVGVGYPLRIAAEQGSQQLAGALLAGSYLAISAGFSLLFLFTWRVFRPPATWARLFAATGVMTELGAAAYLCVQVILHGAVGTTQLSLAEILLQTLPLMIAYLWTAWESLRYHGAMRRRVQLGLADAAVSERFLLWGLMALSATAGIAVNTAAIAMQVPMLDPRLLLGSSFTGLCQTVLLLLVFAPPRAYLRWVRARAAASGD